MGGSKDTIGCGGKGGKLCHGCDTSSFNDVQLSEDQMATCSAAVCLRLLPTVGWPEVRARDCRAGLPCRALMLLGLPAAMSTAPLSVARLGPCFGSR